MQLDKGQAASLLLAAACGGVCLTSGAVGSTAREACFWLFVAVTAFNPLSLLDEHRHLVLPTVVLAWLGVCLCVSAVGSPTLLVEQSWRAMTARFSLFQISVFGSAALHVVLTLVLNAWPMILQNIPRLQKYKIQQDKAPASAQQWSHVFVHIGASQLLVQLPLITGQYFFLWYFDIPFDYDSMPGTLSMAWRVALSLVVDDTWVYFGHRALHHRSIYKYIHKVHHTYTSPFAPDAEYEHPVETVVLGVGFFLACTLFTNHLLFMWIWLYVRLLVTYDSHSGYDLPLNLFHLMPCYNGAREHDWHHQFFNGNYAPTFTWWDRLLGTSVQFEDFERRRKALQQQSGSAAAAATARVMESAGTKPKAAKAA